MEKHESPDKWDFRAARLDFRRGLELSDRVRITLRFIVNPSQGKTGAPILRRSGHELFEIGLRSRRPKLGLLSSEGCSRFGEQSLDFAQKGRIRTAALETDNANLIDKEGHWNRFEAERSAEDIRRIDRDWKGDSKFLREGSDHSRSLDVHRDGEQLEIFPAIPFVEFLPDWQIIPAASPARPAIDQDAFAAKIRQGHGTAVEFGEAKIRRELADPRDARAGRAGRGPEREAHSLPILIEGRNGPQHFRQGRHRNQRFRAVPNKLLERGAAIAGAYGDLVLTGQAFDRDSGLLAQRLRGDVRKAVSLRRADHKLF